MVSLTVQLDLEVVQQAAEALVLQPLVPIRVQLVYLVRFQSQRLASFGVDAAEARGCSYYLLRQGRVTSEEPRRRSSRSLRGRHPRRCVCASAGESPAVGVLPVLARHLAVLGVAPSHGSQAAADKTPPSGRLLLLLLGA